MGLPWAVQAHFCSCSAIATKELLDSDCLLKLLQRLLLVHLHYNFMSAFAEIRIQHVKKSPVNPQIAHSCNYDNARQRCHSHPNALRTFR